MRLGSRVRSARGGVALVAALAILAGVALGGGADAVVGGQTLIVTDDDGTELLAIPVDEETEVVIEYTHSVEKTTVRDVYTPGDERLVMTRMEFSSFGAGLPSRADVTVDGSRYVYHPPSEEYSTLHLKTGGVADHDLIVGDERYDIAAMSDDGAVELTVERRLTPRL
ncbi:DUF1850 domain-containing protein [Halorubrum sp. AD140]|uniref:DUF1850 domain-containing protein n=1 Tax=Halorubrum sp. AD140 TaxID=3050073 RepID=UPI002ACCFFDF|nr:DUF1850 domain-containing protein [Halorubrum sp. AD140]MDZ5812065.1 DUF1850 domain-containing protein [Halorubrum sp. AD140]